MQSGMHMATYQQTSTQCSSQIASGRGKPLDQLRVPIMYNFHFTVVMSLTLLSAVRAMSAAQALRSLPRTAALASDLLDFHEDVPTVHIRSAE